MSWGSLPLDLQGRWRDYDCDIFLQDSAQGMLADSAAHRARAASFDGPGGKMPPFDDFLDDVAAVGDIESIVS